MFNNVAVIPPTESVGSLGDEILLKGLVDSNPKSKYTLLLQHSNKNAWKYLKEYPYDFDFIKNCKKYDIVFAIGADCIDGRYSIDFLEKIKFLNQNTSNFIRIISCSYNKNPSINSINLIKSLNDNVSFYFRDIYSKERFDILHNKKTFLMSDLGFALTEQYYNFEKTNSILLNLNNMNKQADQYLFEYLKLFKNEKITLLQHDFRNGHDELIMLQNLKMNIQNSNFIENKNVNELKNLYTNIKYGISARLHICIMSLSKGVPIIGLDYQDKMQGVFYEFGVQKLVCSDPKELKNIHDDLMNNFSNYKNSIISNIEKVSNNVNIIWK